jgi:hypothetical protein
MRMTSSHESYQTRPQFIKTGSAQIAARGHPATDRAEIQKGTLSAKEGKTNYFQMHKAELNSAANPTVTKTVGDITKTKCNTANVGFEPIEKYVNIKNGKRAREMKPQPQNSNTSFSFQDQSALEYGIEFKDVPVDAARQKAFSEILTA